MKTFTLLAALLLSLPGCITTPEPSFSGYRITQYDSDGNVKGQWETDKVKLEPGRVSWKVDGDTRTVTGSYLVERMDP